MLHSDKDEITDVKLLRQKIFCGRRVYNFWKFEVLGIYQIESYFLSHVIIMAEWMKPIDE